jgi:protein involved in polysaccharide export with SLBB domain
MDDLKKSAGHNVAISCSRTPDKVISHHRIFTIVTITSLFLLLFLLNACGTASKSPPPTSPPLVRQPSYFIPEYEINAGDILTIKFYYNNELNEEVTVRPDGRISLQLAGEVWAAGLTPAELKDILTEIYSNTLVDPELTVLVKTFESHKVYVDGEVGNSRLIKLVGSMTALQAISQSQGFKNTARRDEVVVIRRVPDSEPLIIKVNLEEALNGTDISQDIALQPSDIVYVPKSAIANVNLWVKQYIYNIVPYSISFGTLKFPQF